MKVSAVIFVVLAVLVVVDASMIIIVMYNIIVLTSIFTGTITFKNQCSYSINVYQTGGTSGGSIATLAHGYVIYILPYYLLL